MTNHIKLDLPGKPGYHFEVELDRDILEKKDVVAVYIGGHSLQVYMNSVEEARKLLTQMRDDSTRLLDRMLEEQLARR